MSGSLRVIFSCLSSCLALAGLAGCSFDFSSDYPPRASRISPLSKDFTSVVAGVEQGRPIEELYPEAQDDDNPVKKAVRLGLSRDESKALGCSMGDRFDRGAALAYNFSDKQSRVALHLSLSGPSFSDPGRLEVDSVMVRFTHKFQKPSRAQEKKCLFPSQVQGVIGSVYNEFFVRDTYTILDELKDRGLDLK